MVVHGFPETDIPLVIPAAKLSRQIAVTCGEPPAFVRNPRPTVAEKDSEGGEGDRTKISYGYANQGNSNRGYAQGVRFGT